MHIAVSSATDTISYQINNLIEQIRLAITEVIPIAKERSDYTVRYSLN